MTIQGKFPVLSNRHVRGNTWRLSFHAPQIAAEAAAGQFLTVRIPGGHDPLLRRPFGVHRVGADAEGAVEILYRVVGRGTGELTRLREEERIDVLGPIGTGFGSFPEKTQHILVAGGIGIAPFPMLAGRIRSQVPGGRVRLFFGGRTAGDLAGIDETSPHCDEIVTTTEDGSEGAKGLVTEPLSAALADLDAGTAVVYVCGPLPMLAAAARIVLPLNIRCEVSLESQMACGMGTCLGCVTETMPVEKAGGVGLPISCETGSGDDCYQRVCTEGPVFDARTIQWETALSRA